MTQRVRQRGGVLVSPTCRRVCDGFPGSHCYRQIGTTGIYADQPIKDKWSQPMCAIQYVATGLFPADRQVDEEAIVENLDFKALRPLCGY